MFSQILTEIFQHAPKEIFPKFAYWLYYSEMTLCL